MFIKDKILKTAEKLYLKFGARSISMDDLASELGVSKKTLYKHFESKDELVYLVVKNYFENEEEDICRVTSDAENALDEMFRVAKHIRHVLKNINIGFLFELKKYHHSSWLLYKQDHTKFIKEHIENNIKRGITEGLYREEINAKVVAQIYMTKTILFADESTFPSKHYPREALFNDFFDYHIYGIASPKGILKFEELKKYEV